MNDIQMGDAFRGLSVGGDPILGFATRVLEVLVTRNNNAAAPTRQDLVVALADCMVNADQARIEKTLNSFRRACIAPVTMTDVYIPAAARHLGLHWTGDGLCFADVTIATARLQALARAVTTRWLVQVDRPQDRRSVLMIVPADEDHTLGAVIATGQLRRAGLSVCLRLAPTRTDTARLLQSRDFDAVFLSVGHSERLEVARNLVNTIRQAGSSLLPVAVGGAVVQKNPEVAARIGADHASADIASTVLHLGLVCRARADGLPA